MQYVVALLVVIALAIIGGPVVGGMAFVAMLMFMVPVLGPVMAGAMLLMALLVFFGAARVVLVVAGFAGVSAIFIAAQLLIVRSDAAAKEIAKQASILDRKLVPGTDLYRDQYGQHWKKVAGIYKPVRPAQLPSGV